MADDDSSDGKAWEDGKTRPRCRGKRRDNKRCTLEELPDLGYCFVHTPDELIPQAEMLTGKKRCTGHVVSTGPDGEPTAHTWQRCGRPAAPGGDVCLDHGGTLQPVKQSAFEAILNKQSAELLNDISEVEQKTGAIFRLHTGVPVTNPFEELMRTAGELIAFKDRLGARIDRMKIEEFRYEHSRAGEQIRAEIIAYIKVMDQISTILTRITRLNIEERMLRLSERQTEIIEQAVVRTLSDPEFDLPVAIQKRMRDKLVDRLVA